LLPAKDVTINPPFSRTHRGVFVARFVFLATLLACIIFVGARGNFTSRASDKAAVTAASSDKGRNTASSKKYASAIKPSTFTPVCTTDPVVVNNADSGAGSLRQAIADACDASTITFNMAMVTSPISLTTAELSINQNLTITGPGSSLLTIARSLAGGTPQFRIFNIGFGTVNISGLTVTNGNTPDGAPGGTIGGTATDGGGIRNAGSLTMSDVSVIGNRSGNGGNATSLPGDGGRAGGVYNVGSFLTMTNCTISGNNAGAGGSGGTGSGGGRGGDGGGIYSQSGNMTLTNVIITNNTGGASTEASGFGGMGGAIFNNVPSTASLTNCTVSGNSAGDATGPSSANGFAGGLFNGGAMTVTSTSVSSNTSHGPGGAVMNRPTGVFTLINSTISGNSAAFAGAVYNDNGSVSFTNSTITNNSAPGNGGVETASGSVKVRNTIIAGNGTGTDLLGTFTSLGNNLIGKSDGINGFTNGSNGDQVGSVASPLDPHLGPLANNGGPTQTHALLAVSTAIDAGNNCVLNNSCSPSLGLSLTTDQRGAGFARSTDGNGDGTATVDIGAYEVGIILVTNTNDSGPGSLRQAITDANVNADTNAIIFQPGLTGTISLVSALPSLSTSMLISGPGANQMIVQRSTAGGTPDFRIFKINSGNTVSISGLTITNGRTLASFGGGIFNELSTLNLRDCAISGNSAVHGGGIYNNLGTLSVTNSTFSGNSSTTGSGGGIFNDSTLNVTNSTFSGNSGGTSGGGGIANVDGGTVTVTNSTLTGNSAGSGGGISSVNNSPVNIRNSIIALNTSSSTCGGACPSGSPDLFGSNFTSQGHNLIGKSDGSNGFTNGINGDQVGSVATPLDPRLGPLANNGGSTQTHALLADSSAIDAGDNCALTNACSPSLGFSLATDQRGAGFNRSVDGNGDGIATVDIGAYEVQSILVTNTNDSGAGSLRQAITDANINADTNAINFQAGLTGTIALLTALPDLLTSMSINGPGANQIILQRSTAGGTPDFRIFSINSGSSVKISGLTMSNGKRTGGLAPNNSGGAVGNNGTLTLTNSTLSGNTAINGGGGVFNNGTLNLINSTVTGNSASVWGGG
jgi:hypothetical protein